MGDHPFTSMSVQETDLNRYLHLQTVHFCIGCWGASTCQCPNNQWLISAVNSRDESLVVEEPAPAGFLSMTTHPCCQWGIPRWQQNVNKRAGNKTKHLVWGPPNPYQAPIRACSPEGQKGGERACAAYPLLNYTMPHALNMGGGSTLFLVPMLMNGRWLIGIWESPLRRGPSDPSPPKWKSMGYIVPLLIHKKTASV